MEEHTKLDRNMETSRVPRGKQSSKLHDFKDCLSIIQLLYCRKGSQPCACSQSRVLFRMQSCGQQTPSRRESYTRRPATWIGSDLLRK